MIEYLLIFALGFCASALLVLVAAPALHRRVVTLTERRMRATVALTAAEVRAEKDAARARDAAEKSRLTAQLKEERDRRGSVAVESGRLSMELARAREAHAELDHRFVELSQARDRLSEELRRKDAEASDLEAALDAGRQVAEAKDRYIEELTSRADVLSGSLSQAEADITVRDRHAEMLRGRVEALRNERSELRDEIKAATEAARRAQVDAERERGRADGLDEKLAASMSQLGDREDALEFSRRTGEELGRRLSAETAAKREFEERCRELQRELARLHDEVSRDRRDDFGSVRPHFERARAMNGRSHENPAVGRRIERLRKRHASLVGRLSEADGGGSDDALLREEIAEVAALMVDLTAAREGPSSPIHAILANPDFERDDGAPSLAERSRRQIEASADSE